MTAERRKRIEIQLSLIELEMRQVERDEYGDRIAPWESLRGAVDMARELLEELKVIP